MNLAVRPWIIALILGLLALSPTPAHAGMTDAEVKAFEGYKAKALKGDSDAQGMLGVCYFNGYGVAKDEVEAYAYYNLAGITNEIARKNLANLEQGMSPEIRIRGQQRTKELQKEIEAKIAGKKAAR